MADLNGRRVAILATDGFEQAELLEPREALREAGADAQVVSPKDDSIRGWDGDDWGDEVDVDVPLGAARADDFDALLLPGGVMNPDNLRKDEDAVRFVRSFFDADKQVAAICHGPWLLAEADVLSGRKLTSYSSIRTDLENAGANWVDEEVVTDRNLVTSRNPDDIPAFNRAMIELFAGAPRREHQPA